MRVKVTEFEKVYSFEMAPVTQLCGQNVQRKNYICESIRKYFSTYKYSEIKNSHFYFSPLITQFIADSQTHFNYFLFKHSTIFINSSLFKTILQKVFY